MRFMNDSEVVDKRDWVLFVLELKDRVTPDSRLWQMLRFKG